MARRTKQVEPTPTEETVRFTVDLPLSLHIQFTMLAALQRKSKAELVRTAIEQMLNPAKS